MSVKPGIAELLDALERAASATCWCQDERLAILSYVAGLERDTERYRWLRDEPSSHLYVRLKEKMTTSGMSVCSGPTLDYEIDKRLADAIAHADEGGK